MATEPKHVQDFTKAYKTMIRRLSKFCGNRPSPVAEQMLEVMFIAGVNYGLNHAQQPETVTMIQESWQKINSQLPQ